MDGSCDPLYGSYDQAGRRKHSNHNGWFSDHCEKGKERRKENYQLLQNECISRKDTFGCMKSNKKECIIKDYSVMMLMGQNLISSHLVVFVAEYGSRCSMNGTDPTTEMQNIVHV
jgi:hypothetical protein